MLPGFIPDAFNTVPLSAAAGVSLSDRLERKFVLPAKDLSHWLMQLNEQYSLVATQSGAGAAYTTQYFDTADFRLYHDHHNGRAFRTKVRTRSYLAGGKHWLELKRGGRHGRVHKERVLLREETQRFSEKELDFLRQHLHFDPALLLPSIQTHYTRITLLSKTENERVTADINIGFSAFNRDIALGEFTILEVKGQAGEQSMAVNLLRDGGIRSVALSKYCLGINYLYPELKKNNFKRRLRQVEMIQSWKH